MNNEEYKEWKKIRKLSREMERVREREFADLQKAEEFARLETLDKKEKKDK